LTSGGAKEEGGTKDRIHPSSLTFKANKERKSRDYTLEWGPNKTGGKKGGTLWPLTKRKKND